MKKTDITALAKENAFDLIGKKWMLVTAGTQDNFNTMTASWGGIGWLWNKAGGFRFHPSGTLYPRFHREIRPPHTLLLPGRIPQSLADMRLKERKRH